MVYELDNAKERGWVLRILDRMYPDPLDQDTLKKQLDELRFTVSDRDYRGDIAFLEEQELIRREEIGFGGLKRVVLTLTYKGKNLVDGNSPPVPGVDV